MRHSSASKSDRALDEGPHERAEKSKSAPVALSHGEISDYACEILSSLHCLTSAAQLVFLSYLLEMAYKEAVAIGVEGVALEPGEAIRTQAATTPRRS